MMYTIADRIANHITDAMFNVILLESFGVEIALKRITYCSKRVSVVTSNYWQTLIVTLLYKSVNRTGFLKPS